MSIPASPLRAHPVLRPVPSDSKDAQCKNFGLTPAAFRELAAGLRAGDDTLFERVFLAHFDRCRTFLANHEGLDPEAAYDATMDALLHFRLLILQEKVRYGNLAYLFTAVARQRYRKGQRKSVKTTALNWLTEEPADEPPAFSEEDFRCLSKSLAALGTDCQQLLRRFYFDRRSLKAIAGEQARSPVAVRKQKSRCLARLRNFYLLTFQ